ncbi:flavin reductase family protein [Actinoallomurus sp. NPDC052308]|uniref:flavin reductase family protein n=1 Tax=Actinoallomurus sp. NPDC052308 TaxID=3155530 RepID=UPI0034401296
MGTRVSQRPVVDGASFRRAVGRHAAGVVVVTGPGQVGLTATSFTSVSLDPPLVSFCVGRASTTWPRLRDAATFAVNVLATDQTEIASRFAGPGGGRFAPPTSWRPGPGEVPILNGTAAYLLCEPYDTVAMGDHWLVVGLVVETGVGPPGAPLLYHRGRYGRFTAHGG